MAVRPRTEIQAHTSWNKLLPTVFEDQQLHWEDSEREPGLGMNLACYREANNELSSWQFYLGLKS